MKFKRITASYIILFSLIIAISAFINVKALTYPVLSYSLSSGSIYTGDSFDISVNIKDAMDLYGASVDLCYDPALMEIKSITKGSLVTGFNEIDLSAVKIPGKISAACLLQGNVPGLASGSGQLYVIHAKALKAGSMVLKATNGNGALVYNGTNIRVQLSNSSGSPIDYSVNDFTVKQNGIGTPSLTAAPASSASIKLSYGAVSGAGGYEIYKAASSTGTYSLLTSTTATSYINTGLTAGSTYYYKVRAYRLSGTVKTYGSFSPVVTAKLVPAAPGSLTAVSSSYNSIKISYGAVTGAAGYEISRSISSTGTYSPVIVTSAASCINTGLTTGSTYYYKVRAYFLAGSIKIYGGYSPVISAKPVPSVPASVNAASSGYNSIKTSWALVAGASGYQVYRASSSTGTYTLAGTTTALSYNNTGLSTNSTYYYKIRAYRLVGTTNVYGGYSSVVSSKPIPSVPANFKAVRYSSSSIKLTWSGVSGASGYEIYRSTSSTGTYSLLKSTTALYYINTGLTTGRMYYYKIRAYRVVGTAKIYSNWTSVMYAKP